jgi:hypothetical protein
MAHTDHHSPARAPVYVVAGGNMVAVFTDPDSAAIQHHVMTGANLDPITRRISTDQWTAARARLRSIAPGLAIVDTRPEADRRPAPSRTPDLRTGHGRPAARRQGHQQRRL